MFELATHIHSKSCSVKLVAKEKFVNKKRSIQEYSNNNPKRIRTPSPVSDFHDKELKKLLLYKNKLKYGGYFTEDFLPTELFAKFHILPKRYKVLIDYKLEKKEDVLITSSLEDTIKILKNILNHSIVISQENNWIFITQIEVYFKQKEIDDAAIISKLDTYQEIFFISMEKFQERKGTWYELRFTFEKFEVIATGGISNGDSNKQLDYFLGAAAPSKLAFDSNFILFSPLNPVDTISSPRMLRNYQKKSSMNEWCFKSSFFNNIDFVTPEPLKLYETESLGYISTCSKLLHLTSYKLISLTEVNHLKDKINKMECWKDLGFKEIVDEEEMLKKQVTEDLLSQSDSLK